MSHSTELQHAKQTTSKVEGKATQPVKNTNCKVEEEPTLPKGAQKTTSKADEHTLPQPKLTTKELYWRCCKNHDNYGGEFPQRCEKCNHFWCKKCPFSYSGGKAAAGS